MGIFELHFHDSEFNPSLHVGPKEAGETESETVETTEDAEGTGRSVLLAVVAAVTALAVGAVVVKKLRS